MSFVKTFEQFKQVPLNEASEPKQIQAKEGELARWDVVLKSKDDRTISNKNPSATIIRELAEYGGFINWWNSSKNGLPNEKSLAIIYTGVTGKKNLWGKEVAKAEVAFFPYLEQAKGVVASDRGAAAIVLYDVTAIDPIAQTQVEESAVPLMVWHSEDLPKLKIKNEAGFFQAKDKKGELIPFDQVNPPYMRTNGMGAADFLKSDDKPGEEKETDPKTQVDQKPGENTNPPANAASEQMKAVTDKFIGLKMNNAFNQLAKDLQEIIVANGSEVRPTDPNLLKDYDTRASAATKIRTAGGADGRYGNATGTAIGILIGTNQVVSEVTKEVADKIANSLTGISSSSAAALIGAAANDAKPRQQATVKPKPRP